MTDSLWHAYLPLFVWTGLGIVLFRFLPDTLPRWLGRGLYWVGVPLEVLALARQTDFSAQVGLAPVITIATLLTGLVLAGLSLWALQAWRAEPSSPLPPSDAPSPLSLPLPPTWGHPPRQGSFLISSILGNTGFVGLAVVPAFVDPAYLGWVVIFGITQNVLGTYGLGVLIASRWGRSEESRAWWKSLRDVATVPSLWAFAIGTSTQSIALPALAESGLQAAVWLIIPVALLLMGMRMSQLQGWKSLQGAIVPALLKALVLPALIGVGLTLLGLEGDPRLAMVLMTGMPTAFAGLILAEEYDLDRELIASSIVLTTALLVITIPGWLFLFGTEGWL